MSTLLRVENIFGSWGLDTIKQAGKITKTSFNLKTEKEKTEIHYIISSLLPQQASALELLRYSVNNWSIKNILHRTRDVVFREDVCNISCHRSQQNSAAIRNLAIYLLSKIDRSIT